MITIGSDTARSPIRKLDRDIRSVEDWFRLAPPKRSSQWKDGRSAKELAHYWLKETVGNRFPPAVEALLLQSHDFSSVLRWSAEPEAQSRFDDFGGEPRNCDLLVDAEDRRGKYIIAIEAKADESFDRYLPDILANALERRLRNPSSSGIERILQLTSHILGEGPKGAPQVNQIRYQLLTATAGLLAEARRKQSDRAVLCIQEFFTDATQDALHRRNSEDLSNFVRRLSRGACGPIGANSIVGPVPLARAEPGIQLYVAKQVINLRSGLG